MKQNLQLLLIPFELLLLSIVTFITMLGLSIYLFLCVLVELFKKGYEYGFRRNIT